MFPKGVSHYVDLMEDLLPQLKDGTIRTAIDTGCGVSSSIPFESRRVRICVVLWVLME